MPHPPPPPGPYPHPARHWLRHTARVPKGFLRFHVLKLLKEKPLSGSEIMNAIEQETSGHWKPSPGSVYPLLAWLQDNSFIEELPKQESGIKRYKLTKKGEKFSKEQATLHEKLEDRLEYFSPPFFGGRIGFLGKQGDMREPVKRVFKALIDLRLNRDNEEIETLIPKVAKILNSTAEKLEELVKSTSGKK